MINYKWCVSDMDGTLLNSNDVISEENEKALKKLQNLGAEVIIASGRMDIVLKSFIKQLDLNGYVISCNGGFIRHTKTNKVLYSKAIEKAIVKEITTYCSKNKVNFVLYTSNVLYSSGDNYIAKKYSRYDKKLVEYLQDCNDDKINEIINNVDVFKILLVCGDNEKVVPLQNYFSSFNGISVVSSVRGLLDIMASDISKGSGLKILAEKLNVNLDNVIAFGDGYNDLEMLQCVGMPIAVSNAEDCVKKAAKYVTKSNDDSGVAYAINNFILKD